MCCALCMISVVTAIPTLTVHVYLSVFYHFHMRWSTKSLDNNLVGRPLSSVFFFKGNAWLLVSLVSLLYSKILFLEYNKEQPNTVVALSSHRSYSCRAFRLLVHRFFKQMRFSHSSVTKLTWCQATISWSTRCGLR